MSLTDVDRAFRIVLAARDSKNELFCKKSRQIFVFSDREPSRFSVNVVLGVKQMIEANLDLSCFICGGGYGCFRFELGSNEKAFTSERLSLLFAQPFAQDYLEELGVNSVVFRGENSNAAYKKEELLYSGSAS